eukprot:101989-Hanusia_phi.AAC.1
MGEEAGGERSGDKSEGWGSKTRISQGGGQKGGSGGRGAKEELQGVFDGSGSTSEQEQGRAHKGEASTGSMGRRRKGSVV